MENRGKRVLGDNVRRFREALDLTQESLSERAGLDRSYIGGIERAERNPALSTIIRLASALGVPPARLLEGTTEEVSQQRSPGLFTAIEAHDGLLFRFRYGQYDAQYVLPAATIGEFDDVVNVLKSGLLHARNRADAGCAAFLRAVSTWPTTNPSDLWTLVINRAYCDPNNHPSTNGRLNLEQSWKRTSGWALERIAVTHYRAFLERAGITIKTGTIAEKRALLEPIGTPNIVPDKADLLLTYRHRGGEILLGVIHVKASIAERRTDDVPMSQALIDAGFLSVFWTMDSKMFPSTVPMNRGEFGAVEEQQLNDKRMDFEDRGLFSACFSYNTRTVPTPPNRNVAARILVCDFTNSDDLFARFVVEALNARLHH